MLLPTLHGHAINCVPVHRFRMRRTSKTGLPLAARREILRYALARILMHAVKTEPARFWRVFGWFVALFYRFPVRNALRASQAVHATDVMVNARILAVIQIVAAPRRGPLLVELMGLEPMTNELEVHCSSN